MIKIIVILVRKILFGKIWRDINSLLNREECYSVLDIGCGRGDIFPYINNNGKKISGIDISIEKIKEARNRFRTFVTYHGSIRDLIKSCNFDAYIAFLFFHAIPMEERDEIIKILPFKKGSAFIVVDFSIPENRNFYGKFMSAFFRIDEQQMIKIDADHYDNYLSFINGGGCNYLFNYFSSEVFFSKEYFGGAMKVIAIRCKD